MKTVKINIVVEDDGYYGGSLAREVRFEADYFAPEDLLASALKRLVDAELKLIWEKSNKEDE